MKRWAFLAAVVAVILAADQATKFLAVEHLTTAFGQAHAATLGERIAAYVGEKDLEERGLAWRTHYVVRDYWAYRYAQNRGSAFSLFANLPASARVPLFNLITIGAVIFIVSYYKKLRADQRLLHVALALVLGGALGNFLDRLMHGYVVDFIAWYWRDPLFMNPGVHWPTFNFADTCISVGVALMLLEGLVAKKTVGHPQAART